MKLNQRNTTLTTYHQEGSALLIALILVIVFTLLGVITAEKAKTNASVTGSKVRYSVVFEAAEQSLRDAILFIHNIRTGVPIATSNGSQGRNLVSDFTLDVIKEQGKKLNTDTATSFVWQEGALELRVCGGAGANSNCPAGIDFIARLDDPMWRDLAIRSQLASNTPATATSAPAPSLTQIDNNNYLLNTETYTFIQLIKNSSLDGGYEKNGVMQGTNDSTKHYLVTVKASGYIPGVARTNDNSRENVILQAVYSQKQ